MNVREGSRRMKRLGRGAVLLSVVFVALIILVISAGRAFGAFPLIEALPVVALLGVYPALGGAILWMAGYIIEGFAAPPSEAPFDQLPPAHSAPLGNPDRA